MLYPRFPDFSAELKSEFIAVTDRIVKPGKDGVEEVAVTLILRPKKEKVK